MKNRLKIFLIFLILSITPFFRGCDKNQSLSSINIHAFGFPFTVLKEEYLPWRLQATLRYSETVMKENLSIPVPTKEYLRSYYGSEKLKYEDLRHEINNAQLDANDLNNYMSEVPKNSEIYYTLMALVLNTLIAFLLAGFVANLEQRISWVPFFLRTLVFNICLLWVLYMLRRNVGDWISLFVFFPALMFNAVNLPPVIGSRVWFLFMTFLIAIVIRDSDHFLKNLSLPHRKNLV